MNNGFHGTGPSLLREVVVSESEKEFVFLLKHAGCFLQ